MIATNNPDQSRHRLRKPFCNICLKETRVQRLEKLDVCDDCLVQIRKLEKEHPLKITKEQIPGGIKNEL